MGESAIMKKTTMVGLIITVMLVIGVGYLSTVQIPAPEKTVSKLVPNEQLPR